MLVTTTPTIEGGRITRYYGIVSGTGHRTKRIKRYIE